MDSKTENGVIVTASQRMNRDMPVGVGSTIICTGSMGELILSSSVGDERATEVRAAISLDEVLAWLPEMTEKARRHAAGKARQKLTEDAFKEGYTITTHPRVKITPHRAP